MILMDNRFEISCLRLKVWKITNVMPWNSSLWGEINNNIKNEIILTMSEKRGMKNPQQYFNDNYINLK